MTSKTIVSLEDLEKISPYRHPENISVYRNIIVVWDSDFDFRVFNFIDKLPCSIRELLVGVSEHEGSLGLLWAGQIPPGWNHIDYEIGDGMDDYGGVVVAGDYWGIVESISIS